LKKNIALAYVPVQYAGVDEVVAAEIRGQLVKARVVATPFYKRPRKTA
jgi:aminomethyltransferase